MEPSLLSVPLQSPGTTVKLTMSAMATLPMMEKPCAMCNDKKGLGAPPKPKNKVYIIVCAKYYNKSVDIPIPQNNVCQRCLNCKTCSAQMSPGKIKSLI